MNMTRRANRGWVNSRWPYWVNSCWPLTGGREAAPLISWRLMLSPSRRCRPPPTSLGVEPRAGHDPRQCHRLGPARNSDPLLVTTVGRPAVHSAGRYTSNDAGTRTRPATAAVPTSKCASSRGRTSTNVATAVDVARSRRSCPPPCVKRGTSS